MLLRDNLLDTTLRAPLEKKKKIKREPIVDVILPTYNRDKLLKRAIGSVLKQNYQNLVIHIIDDASVDNTFEIAKEFARKDKRINYYRHNQNMGNAFARNTGLNFCQGDYIAFIDDDDEWIDPNKTKKQIKLLEEEGDKVGIVCSSVIIVKDDKTITKNIKEPKDIKERILKGNGLIFTPTVMTKKELALKVGGFETDLPRGVDSDFYRDLILQGEKVIFMKDITAKIYETSPNRISDRGNINGKINHIKSIQFTLDKNREFFQRYEEALVSRYLQIALTNYLLFLQTGNKSYKREVVVFLNKIQSKKFKWKVFLFKILIGVPGFKNLFPLFYRG